jgi:hypothetical protein
LEKPIIWYGYFMMATLLWGAGSLVVGLGLVLAGRRHG